MNKEAQKAQFTKTRELVYEMKVSEVMTRNVEMVEPEMRMNELRQILRTKRISGTPVVSQGQLVGIISIEDFINWLTSGPDQATIGDLMTREVTTIYDDEPLVQVVSRLDKYGYGRLPVLQRDGQKLVGVVTKGDIVATGPAISSRTSLPTEQPCFFNIVWRAKILRRPAQGQRV
ncbi:MAG: CBS domain-containing protein [Planctomycetota bacterium]